MPDSILRTRDLVKSFGGIKAVDRVSIDVREKTMTMLIGPNGSGKTTLINLVTGVYKPDHGKIYFDGTEITGYPSHEVFRLGVARTFQIPQPFRKLTVLENLLVTQPGNPGEGFIKSMRRRNWKRFECKSVEKAFRILKFLNLNHLWDQEAEKLSGGQMKLLEVGRTLMTGAKLLIMDEPIAGVASTLAHEVLKTFIRLRDELGVTFFLVEHRLDIALQYTDYVYVMATGSIIAEGGPTEVIHDHRVIEAYLGE